MKKLFLIFLLCIGAFNLTGGAAYQNQDFESGIVYEMPDPYEALLGSEEDPEDEEEEKEKTGSSFATIKKINSVPVNHFGAHEAAVRVRKIYLDNEALKIVLKPAEPAPMFSFLLSLNRIGGIKTVEILAN
jgi:hypothetical protein